MNYILKGDNDYNNPIDTILKNRDINKELFSLDESVIENYNNYTNMELGIEVLLKHINNNDKIAIIPDVDSDGLTSSAILYRYIRDVIKYENIIYIMHTKKIHGLSKDIHIDDDVKLILLPDASSSDFEKHKYFKEKDIDIIVTDHHPATHLSEHAIVINNRLSEKVRNKNLSGAGVTYKFLKALDDYLFENKADDYLDLVAVGNIADMMSLKEKETRYLCYKGIQEVNNPFLKALIETSSFLLENKYNIKKISWVIAPKINGTIRSGSQEVKEDMFKAFISDDYEFALSVADKCKTAKSSQDSTVKRILPKIEEKIQFNESDKCLLVEVSKTLKQEHTGLVANKLQEKYGVPVLLYRSEKKGLYSGNARGNSNITDNFKEDLNNSNLVEMCEGQPNAFGWSVKAENLEAVKNYLNNLYDDKEVVSGKIYEVDLILNEENLNNEIVSEIAMYEDEWGNGVSEPLLLFQNLHIDINETHLKGNKRKNLVFQCNDVKFIKKPLSNTLKDEVLDKGILSVDIIGKCVKNYYNGNEYSQVEIINIEINK